MPREWWSVVLFDSAVFGVQPDDRISSKRRDGDRVRKACPAQEQVEPDRRRCGDAAGRAGWQTDVARDRGGSPGTVSALLAVAVVACGGQAAPARVDVQGYCRAVGEVAEAGLGAAARARARAAHGTMSKGSAEELLPAQREVHGLMIDYRVTRAFAAAESACANAVCPQWLDPMLMVGKG
jgi:hypothetical protein